MGRRPWKTQAQTQPQLIFLLHHSWSVHLAKFLVLCICVFRREREISKPSVMFTLDHAWLGTCSLLMRVPLPAIYSWTTALLWFSFGEKRRWKMAYYPTRLFHFHQHARCLKAKMTKVDDYKGCHLAASQGWLARPCWVVGDAFAHPTWLHLHKVCLIAPQGKWRILFKM